VTDVDLDRLADYVGGALDGTPDADTVAHLVATEPSWADAYTELVVADASVRADLSVLARTAEPMPAAVAARLTAALVGPPPPRVDPPPARPAAGRPPGRPEQRRRRRWLVGLSVAAAVVAFGLTGSIALPALLSGGLSSRSGRSDTAAKAPAASTLGGSAAAPRLLATGDDYNPTRARGFASRPGAVQAEPPLRNQATDAGGTKENAPAATAPAVPDPLRRLADPAALAVCLAAITREYGGRPTVVDYARFQGTPALVVVLAGAFGNPVRQWVVVVGSRCGEGNSIADEVYNAPVD
jgi:hypothetical protein